jgi:glycosyltransferase involved in cell wall biosynthesis
LSLQLRILVVHNAYQHHGGEDAVLESEISLLRAYGHVLETYTRHNDVIAGIPPLLMARQTLWSNQTTCDINELIQRFRPDVIHAHNTFPLVTPSLYWAAERAGVPVVQTLHNFRLMCLNALFLRHGQVCEDCMGTLPWKGIVNACYRGSYSASVALAGMLALHRGLGTYRNKVRRYIALNTFCRDKFIEGGLPASRIAVKPNFVDWPVESGIHHEHHRGKHFLFVGRLSPEKGVAVLADALALLSSSTLRVAGDGPDATIFDGKPGVVLLGGLSSGAVQREMSEAAVLIVPSIWYENFPRTIVESYASGLPVIASRIGALSEIVRDGETGLLFTPGDTRDLADKMAWAQSHPEEMQRMGREARLTYERLYTPEINYKILMDIYSDAIAEAKVE